MVQGFLTPNKPVSHIFIRRNFKINQGLTDFNIIPDPFKTGVNLTNNQNGTVYKLQLNQPGDFTKPENIFYFYPGSDLKIEPGNTYSLEIQTEIDGQKIWAQSTTTVPQTGFHIVSQNFDSLYYRQRDGQGKQIVFEFTIQRSPGIDFYAYSIQAMTNDYAHYIDGGINNIKTRDDFEKERDRLSYHTRWIQNTPDTPGQSTVRALWFDLHFYSTYRVIIYAADRNYREFLQTFSRVQEIDGNFHEAKFNIKGDGIGVFGSVIPDTAYITVLPNP